MDLKPCPFCGGEAFVLELYKLGRCLVECENCKCRTDYYTTKKQVVEVWNKRVEA